MLYYITGNKHKISVAKKYLSPLGVTFEGKSLDLIETQTDDIAEIAKTKAEQAFALLKQPLFVNDAGWNIPSLNGFPGPFMKYINDWFTYDDLLTLMRDKKNRSILFEEVFCFTNGKIYKFFKGSKKGTILEKPQGDEGISRSLISMRDDLKSISQSWEENLLPTDSYAVWEEFATWYKRYQRA